MGGTGGTTDEEEGGGGERGATTEAVLRWFGERGGEKLDCAGGTEGSRLERARRLSVGCCGSLLRWSKERDWSRARGGARPGGTRGEGDVF